MACSDAVDYVARVPTGAEYCEGADDGTGRNGLERPACEASSCCRWAGAPGQDPPGELRCRSGIGAARCDDINDITDISREGVATWVHNVRLRRERRKRENHELMVETLRC